MGTRTSGPSEELLKYIRKDINVAGLEDLEAFFSVTQPMGSLDQAITNNLYGINQQGVKGLLPENRDSYGFVFFTRPALNLSTVNIRNVRKLYSLLTTQPVSLHRFVRNMLDPRLAVTKSESLLEGIIKTSDVQSGTELEQFLLTRITCPMVDENNGFIPILTNLITKCDGWPDTVIPTFTTKEGMRREQWGMADGSIDIYESWDMNTSFRNIRDEPLILLFDTWLKYMTYVYEDLMSPYMDFIAENEIDYNTRIYRLVLDESKLFVKKIAACGAAFPLNVPNGQFFDYDIASKYNDNTREIPIRWKCFGAEYNDDILVKEFNEVNCIFNSDYRKYIYEDYSPLIEVPFNMLKYFNYRSYPYIDPQTLQLKWLVNSNGKRFKYILKHLEYIYKGAGTNHTMQWKLDGGNNWNVGDIKRKIKNNTIV